MYSEIIQKIVDLLKADKPTLGVEDIYFGEPMRWEKFPHIWVDLLDDNQAPRTTGEELHRMRFQIVVMVRAQTAADADKDVLEKAERVETVLKTKRTLDDLVRDSWVVLKEKRAGAMADYAVSGCRILFYCEKGVTS